MYQHQLETAEAVIASGQSLSAAVDIGGKALVAVITPAAWTAAALGFEKSADGAAFYPAYDESAEVLLPSSLVGTSGARWFSLDPSRFLDATHVKLRSGVNGTPVNQGAERTLVLVMKPL